MESGMLRTCKVISVVLASTLSFSVLSGCGSSAPETEVVQQEEEVVIQTPSVASDVAASVNLPGSESSGESSTTEIESVISQEEPSEIKSASHENIVTLLDSIYDKNPKNIMLSDLSLNMALGMLLQGSEGDTQAELEKYLGLTKDEVKLSQRNLISRYKDIASKDGSDNTKNVQLLLSNAVYADSETKLAADYVDNLVKNYDADARNLDFKDPLSAETINKWCSDNTKGLIPNIVDANTLMMQTDILLNALYFKGTWQEEFSPEDNIRDTFYGTEDDALVDFMTATEHIYYENDNCKAFGKTYVCDTKAHENGFKFIGILPNESIIESNGDFKLSDLDIESLLANKVDEDVMIKLPKFDMSDSNELTSHLSKIGLSAALSGSGIDYASMYEDKSPHQVSSIIQKTVVKVDEEGTEAAAVTAIMKDNAAAFVEENIHEVLLDRPFAFLIYDDVNDEVLFLGKVVSLNE